MFLRNIGFYKSHATSHPRRLSLQPDEVVPVSKNCKHAKKQEEILAITHFAGCKVLPVLSVRSNVSCIIKPHGLDTVQHFRGIYCLCLHGQRASHARNQYNPQRWSFTELQTITCIFYTFGLFVPVQIDNRGMVSDHVRHRRPFLFTSVSKMAGKVFT
jgi:hypothetical protein